MYTQKGLVVVKVKKMTVKDLSLLRGLMTGINLVLLNTRVHLSKEDKEYELLNEECKKLENDVCLLREAKLR